MGISRNTAKRIIENCGASRVSKDAAGELAKIIDDVAERIIKNAKEYAKHAKRKTIIKEDIRRAIKDYIRSENYR